ncbi:MAG: hypothetical protein E7009_00965 [Alphaproteobacteria bacterium]|nr:hypothetical protein [Alphaproteobacteria bacterium]
MKKNLIVTAIGLVLTIPAVATQKCISTDTLDDYNFYQEETNFHGTVLWSVTSDEPKSTYFRGIAIMVSNIDDLGGLEPYDNLEYNGIESSQICACILTYPYPGKQFVIPYPLSGDSSNPANCSQNCATTFSDKTGVGRSFREQILKPAIG